jgi:hypothetical protein
MLPIWSMIIIKEYLTKAGRSPFTKWRGKLDETLQAKVFLALERMQL